MPSVGGNTKALLQVRGVIKNDIGEDVKDWGDVCQLTGWLDMQSGDSKYTMYNAKLEESSHIFICDYRNLGDATSDNARLLIDGQVYNITLIDDPMNMHNHLEIYLRYMGGQEREQQYPF